MKSTIFNHILRGYIDIISRTPFKSIIRGYIDAISRNPPFNYIDIKTYNKDICKYI